MCSWCRVVVTEMALKLNTIMIAGKFENLEPTHEIIKAHGLSVYTFDHSTCKVVHMHILHDGHEMREQVQNTHGMGDGEGRGW
jgi:hypothetical protein